MYTKLLSSILLVLAVMVAQVGNAGAAPQIQESTPITISGTVNNITTELDQNGETVVIVTLRDAQGVTQIVNLSAQEAADNDLFDPATQTFLVQTGDSVELVVDPADVVPNEEQTEEPVHPIAEMLANFFDEDPGVVNGYHEDGFGFGVIAQAMWMSKSLAGDASAAGLILEAKKSGNYSAFTLPDGSSPTNWGQFKKAMRENKDKHNLGVIVSGQADDENSVDQPGQGNGKDKKDKKDKKNKK